MIQKLSSSFIALIAGSIPIAPYPFGFQLGKRGDLGFSLKHAHWAQVGISWRPAPTRQSLHGAEIASQPLNSDEVRRLGNQAST